MAEKYEGIDFKPPVTVAKAAEQGLEYRAKQGKDKAGLDTQEAGKAGIGSGVQRASTLKNRNNVSPKVIKQMVSFFSRHEKNKGIDPKFKGEPWKDKGYVSWLLWGSDPGKAWAKKVLRQMEAADAKAQAKTASITRTDLDRVLGGLLVNFTWPAAKQAAQWMEEHLHKVFLPRTPRGGKELKKKLDLLHHVLVQTYDNSDSRVEQAQSDIRELQPHFDAVVQLFGEGHGAVIPKDIRSGDVLYRNDVGLDEKKLKAFVSKLDALWASVSGWRRKAFTGGLTVVLSGPQAFRSSSVGGTYRSAQDELHVRATPKVLKRSAGYGDPQYILIHELGHRYEYKVRGLPEDFDRQHWWTTRYSSKEGEGFAELFALGHFGFRGNWDDARVQRFERVMGTDKLANRLVERLAREDKLPGGLGDKARREDFDQDQVSKGVKVELEHTNDKDLALEITLDHLTEDKRYYDKLEKIEKHAKKLAERFFAFKLFLTPVPGFGKL